VSNKLLKKAPIFGGAIFNSSSNKTTGTPERNKLKA